MEKILRPLSVSVSSVCSVIPAVVISVFLLLFSVSVFAPSMVLGQESSLILEEEDEVATASSTTIERIEPLPTERPDLTQPAESAITPLGILLSEQEVGSVFPANFIKYAIRFAVLGGVSPNTIVLLLLLPGIATLIAAARHLIGLRGFGIFLPAALSVVFVATGPVIGIGLFLVIVFVSTTIRLFLRKLKIRLQYLPRMALILHFVVLGILMVLFVSPFLGQTRLTNVSIFPVLILVLLAEDFTRVQLGKSARVAVGLTSETLILALGSYVFLTLRDVQEFALLKPEIFILLVLSVNIILGKFVGLRFLEIWRFRKLIGS